MVGESHTKNQLNLSWISPGSLFSKQLTVTVSMVIFWVSMTTEIFFLRPRSLDL